MFWIYEMDAGRFSGKNRKYHIHSSEYKRYNPYTRKNIGP
jgi:hypothetical protein